MNLSVWIISMQNTWYNILLFLQNRDECICWQTHLCASTREGLQAVCLVKCTMGFFLLAVHLTSDWKSCSLSWVASQSDVWLSMPANWCIMGFICQSGLIAAGERTQHTHAGPDPSNRAMRIIHELDTVYKTTGCFSEAVVILDWLSVQWFSTGFVVHYWKLISARDKNK